MQRSGTRSYRHRIRSVSEVFCINSFGLRLPSLVVKLRLASTFHSTLMWRFPETTVVGNRVNSVDGCSTVEGVWSEPEMLRSNIVGERLNSGDVIVGVSIVPCYEKVDGRIALGDATSPRPLNQRFFRNYRD